MNGAINTEPQWTQQIHKRFGESVATDKSLTVSELRRIYNRLSVMKSYAAEFSIVWLNGSYWEIMDDDLSEHGKVAHLNSVCWLEITGNYLLA